MQFKIKKSSGSYPRNVGALCVSMYLLERGYEFQCETCQSAAGISGRGYDKVYENPEVSYIV